MHDEKDWLGCQCEACKVMFAVADEYAAELAKTLVACKREGCMHNNCLFVDGKCAGRCSCAEAGE